MAYETIVVGAGAAGLAAARALTDAGQRVVVLEARARIGGRVQTDYTFGPVPVERGAEFIHGAHGETWTWLRRAGLHTLPVSTWRGRQFALDDRRRAGSWLLLARPDLRRAVELEQAIAQYHGPDCTLGAWLKAHNASPLATQLVFIRLAHANCATLDTLSMATLADEYRLGTDAGGNFHIVEGYERVLAAIAQGLNIRLETPVRAVQWGDDGVEVQTERAVFQARHAVITLPLALLQAERVRFDPPLPAVKQQAIRLLAMRPAMKLLYRFSESFWPRNLTFLSADSPIAVWWTVRARTPLLVGFATGPHAERLTALGDQAALERGLAALDALFDGKASRRLVDAQLANWGTDPWSGGGYSSVPPGAHGQRAALAALCGALHFAGEATVTDSNPATVHGALRSGERAAREIIDACSGARAR